VSDLGETISNVSCHAEGENSVGREERRRQGTEGGKNFGGLDRKLIE
jgi:hypothetical protein